MNPNTYTGSLIVFEGIDGAGKSTQAEALSAWLKQMGYQTQIVSWVSSEILGKKIKKLKKRKALLPKSFSLLHAADLSDNYDKVIVPALQAGQVVICERYAFTGLARDVVRGLDAGWLRNLYAWACQPTATFYLDIDPATALARKAAQGEKTNYYEAGQDVTGLSLEDSFVQFQTAVRVQYDKLVGEFGFIVLDESLNTIDEQQQLVRKALIEKMLLPPLPTRKAVAR